MYKHSYTIPNFIFIDIFYVDLQPGSAFSSHLSVIPNTADKCWWTQCVKKCDEFCRNKWSLSWSVSLQISHSYRSDHHVTQEPYLVYTGHLSFLCSILKPSFPGKHGNNNKKNTQKSNKYDHTSVPGTENAMTSKIIKWCDDPLLFLFFFFL